MNRKLLLKAIPESLTGVLITISLVLILLSLNFGCSKPQNPTSFVEGDIETVFPGDTWKRVESPESLGYNPDKLEAIHNYVETLETSAVIVVVNGRILFEHGNLVQISYLASCRKSVLAMLYGEYVTNGTILLDKSLKELGMSDVGGLLPIEEGATIRDIISARSGIYHAASNSGDNSADAPPRGSQEPGSYFLYNNWDFNAAGAAFELQTGLNIYDALEQDLAIPINMQDFDRSLQRKSGDLTRSQYPAYHMWLSTRDMARLGYLMLRKGMWEGNQVIPQEWVERSVSIATPIEEMNPPSLREWEFGYGYMWWVWEKYGINEVFKGAYSALGAYGQYITVIPKLNMVIAHKTAVPPVRHVKFDEYFELIHRVAAARN